VYTTNAMNARKVRATDATDGQNTMYRSGVYSCVASVAFVASVSYAALDGCIALFVAAYRHGRQTVAVAAR